MLFDSIPSAKVVLRIEPAAILAAILTQRGQFKQARVYTNVVAVSAALSVLGRVKTDPSPPCSVVCVQFDILQVFGWHSDGSNKRA